MVTKRYIYKLHSATRKWYTVSIGYIFKYLWRGNMAVDTKKEQEREELHRAIWAIADELRGAVDGWDFKNYVL